MAKVAVRRSDVLYDSFTGAGQLAAHTPDVAPVGAAWSVKRGTFPDLADGWQHCGVGMAFGNAVIATGLTECEIEAKVFTHDADIRLIARAEATGAPYMGVRLDVTNNLVISTEHGALDDSGNSVSKALDLVGDANYYIRWWHYKDLARVFVATDGATWTHGGDVVTAYTGTYAGVGWYNGTAAGKIDSLEVKRVGGWRHYAFLGDSITIGSPPADYPQLAMPGVNGGRSYRYNYAVSGANISAGLPAQVALCVAPNLSAICIALGTNEDVGVTTAPAYLAGLQDLRAAYPNAPIYCLGVFDKTAHLEVGLRADVDPIIQACVAQVANSYYWDTTDWIDPATDTGDGLHPNAAGCAKIAAQIVARL